ncbi:MAG: hypothetical protein GY822_27875 [Deltaproteobacteria bacterium]|nr:hypothetical protein [Deltaproteobacteria bacterium]
MLYFDSVEGDFSGVTDFTNSVLPASKSNKPFLAAFWDDLDTVVARTRILGSGNQRTFVIDVDAKRVFCTPCGLGFTIAIYEGDGRLDVHYQDLDDATNDQPQGSSATFGLQSVGGLGAQAALLGNNDTLLRLTTEEQFVTYSKP